MAGVLIDDRDIESALAVRSAAEADGHTTEMVPTLDRLDRMLAGDETLALVLTGDPKAPGTTEMLRIVSSHVPRPPVIMVAHMPDGENPRDLLSEIETWLLPDELILAPPDPEEVKVALTQQIERYELQLETGIVGHTHGVRELLERIHMLAPVNSTVLITGESGTGKELAARAIHRLSPRRGKPFITLNCAAIPETLLESELFGHEKGAFTGATSRRRGMFELADHGTLFLDEIGEMPLPLQTRLLRVLETQKFMRVGGDSEISVDVRIIAATNRDLRQAVEQGTFRRDLYYRLNVLHLDLPPLRDRTSDIPILVRRFIEEFSQLHDREFKGLSREAMQILLDYSWPGNVRELRNLVESMVVLAPGSVIGASDIPPDIRFSSGRQLLPGSGAEVLPTLAGTDPAETGTGLQLPQMEFLFRTLVEMKIDLEDLRSEFERFRRRYPGEVEEGPAAIGNEPRSIEIRGRSLEAGGDPEPPWPGREEMPGPAIAIGPEMTMADIEREAISLALRESDGNRRKAAERLGIGERTLYRKLKEYGLEA
ncbi:MAG: sigma-54 dependent transcriptional regulator [marine benthic group bacterium]|nr:sigma-54 dependent transcriptional regulator [Gemmatimonadota bacterium]